MNVSELLLHTSTVFTMPYEDYSKVLDSKSTSTCYKITGNDKLFDCGRFLATSKTITIREVNSIPTRPIVYTAVRPLLHKTKLAHQTWLGYVKIIWTKSSLSA